MRVAPSRRAVPWPPRRLHRDHAPLDGAVDEVRLLPAGAHAFGKPLAPFAYRVEMARAVRESPAESGRSRRPRRSRRRRRRRSRLRARRCRRASSRRSVPATRSMPGRGRTGSTISACRSRRAARVSPSASTAPSAAAVFAGRCRSTRRREPSPTTTSIRWARARTWEASRRRAPHACSPIPATS